MPADPNYSIRIAGVSTAYGSDGTQLQSAVIPSTSPATLAAMKAIPAGVGRQDGTVYTLQSNGQRWRYSAGSSLTGDDLLVATPGDSVGRYLRVDKALDLVLPITKDTTDTAVLFTVPAGFRLDLQSAFWEVTTSWTGGSSSAIGLSSSNAGLSTAGNVLGGASGDVAATLVSTGAYAKGTVGAKMNAPGAVIVGGETIIFNRITSAFTAGAGNAHVVVVVIAAPSA